MGRKDQQGERVELYVTIGGMKYGFLGRKKVLTSYGQELGQTGVEGGAPEGLFFGANSPKPPRASKQLDNSTSTIRSFCSTNKVESLRRSGWGVSSKTSIRGIKTAGATRTVSVPMPGRYRYAYNLDKDLVDHATILGLDIATGPIDNAVWGSSPKPPRASKRNSDGSTTSTFCAPTRTVIDAASAAGWTIGSLDFELIDDTIV